jgi:hypothetical protein
VKILKYIKSRIPNDLKLLLKIKFAKIFNPLPIPVFLVYGDLKFLKRKINNYTKLFPSKMKAFSDEIDFLNYNADTNNPKSFTFPYSYVFEYDYNKIKVFRDNLNGLFYVIHQGKRLYYTRKFQSENEVKESYNNVLIEQAEKSPHDYINDNFRVEENDIVLDIGAEAGNFSLEIVEIASKLYIIEPDIDWIEALNKTFDPWKEKVRIINKFVSNIDNDKCITLESILGENHVNFIKMDVEGMEPIIIKNSEKILINNTKIKLAICCYHKKDDAKTIEKLLTGFNFKCSLSDGYMLYIHNYLTPPYFRKGLIRAQKIS